MMYFCITFCVKAKSVKKHKIEQKNNVLLT